MEPNVREKLTHVAINLYKSLNYRRETMRQLRASNLAKSGRQNPYATSYRFYSAEIVGLSPTTVT